jgi:hypothetical protein
MKLFSLAELVTSAYDLPQGLVYLQGSYPWAADSIGIFYPSSYAKEIERNNAEFIAEYELKLAFEIGLLQQVVYRTKLQQADVDVDHIVDALNYYYLYDGFQSSGEADS